MVKGQRSRPPTSPRPGRPRSAKADEAILVATLEILAERGIRGLSTAGVAARAHAGKDTIYRRWPTKAELVRAALARAASVAIPEPDTGNLEQDLVAYLDAVATFLAQSDFGRIAASVIGAAVDDPELADAAKAFWGERRAVAARIVERAVERGRLPTTAPVDLLVELLVGPIYYRWLVMQVATDERHIRELVARIIKGDAAG
jgi:AcrR family transcriptional regulator